MSRRPLRLPISLAVVMLVLLVLIIVGFVLIPVTEGLAYWALLVVGLIFLGMVVAGVVVYLTLSIKAINLNRRQSNFIDSVTHELKSPIASLKLYLQTLDRRPVSREEQAGFYKSMLEDVERLDLLINHILTAARLDNDVLNAAERIDLSELLRAGAREVCTRHRISLDACTFDLAPCTVLGNRMDVGLICSNLIDNAIKYGDAKDPQCRIETEYVAARGTVVIRIRDNGPGIPRNLQRKIFGRFVRLGTELERKKPGTGLGLYIVRTLVSRCKGKVKVASASRAGTTFEVILPNATTFGPRAGEIELGLGDASVERELTESSEKLKSKQTIEIPKGDSNKAASSGELDASPVGQTPLPQAPATPRQS